MSHATRKVIIKRGRNSSELGRKSARAAAKIVNNSALAAAEIVNKSKSATAEMVNQRCHVQQQKLLSKERATALNWVRKVHAQQLKL
jgi:hypothetical protein